MLSDSGVGGQALGRFQVREGMHGRMRAAPCAFRFYLRHCCYWRWSQRRAEKSVTMLAANSARLMAKALRTQPVSNRPFNMNLSSRARTRTRTAASAKKDEQRWAEMAIRSQSRDGIFWGMTPPPPDGTSVRRAGEVRVCVEPGVSEGGLLLEEDRTFL
jgi:hypothetical protein